MANDLGADAAAAATVPAAPARYRGVAGSLVAAFAVAWLASSPLTAADDDDAAPAAASEQAAAPDDDDDEAIAAPPRVSIRNGRPVVTLDEVAFERSGIESAPQQHVTAPEIVRAFATVIELDQMTELANAIVTSRTGLQAAEAKLAASRGAFERAQTLFDNNRAIPLAQLQTTEAIFRADEAALLAAQAKARTDLARARQEWGDVIGAALETGGDLAVRLMERKELLVKVTLPADRYVAEPAATVVVRGRGRPTADLRFLSPATETDPRIQGQAFYYLADAASGLQPGMNLFAEMAAGQPVDGALVPPVAVVWWDGSAWVYLRDDLAFTRHRIAATVTGDGGAFVETGLPPDAELVTAGAQALLSEEFRSEIEIEEEEGR